MALGSEIGGEPSRGAELLSELSETTIWLFARLGSAGGIAAAARADGDRRRDREREADGPEGRSRAGLVAGEIAQREPQRDRRSAAERGQPANEQRADEQHPEGGGDRPADDEDRSRSLGGGMREREAAEPDGQEDDPGAGEPVCGFGWRRPPRQCGDDRRSGGGPRRPPRRDHGRHDREDHRRADRPPLQVESARPGDSRGPRSAARARPRSRDPGPRRQPHRRRRQPLRWRPSRGEPGHRSRRARRACPARGAGAAP